jgi:hypothetical protein
MFDTALVENHWGNAMSQRTASAVRQGARLGERSGMTPDGYRERL